MNDVFFFAYFQNEQHMKENCQTEVGDEIPIKPGIGITYEVQKKKFYQNSGIKPGIDISCEVQKKIKVL